MSRSHRPHLGATLLACLLVCAGMGAALRSLTLDFEAWTFEDRRQALAAQGRLVAVPVTGQDQSGQPWASPWGQGAGTVAIVDFIYTRCETVCTALGGTYAQMQAAWLEQTPAPSLQLVSISFDDRDDVAALGQYARLHRAIPGLWQVVRLDRRADRQALLRALGVVAIPDGLGGYTHNGALHVVDGEGHVQGLFDYADWREALALARRLGART
ncbi:SCO family protein [Mitsuaria sp. WAJ17]|uniref:SCO family protein n=1 Tax=Mitsuaria sp. WAJ17 TaxID=2761452 RepID=UPI001601A806|nr:SCO family protein [Mitsuaria sp. WAJ17]MBB2485011.1 SCO family protein [Mitsuaria sp. WAJ17]